MNFIVMTVLIGLLIYVLATNPNVPDGFMKRAAIAVMGVLGAAYAAVPDMINGLF